MKIGVMVESFRRGLAGGLEAARRLGVSGVQLYAKTQEADLCELTGPQRAALARRIADAGLELPAIVACMGGFGLEKDQDNPQRIQAARKAIELAVDLGCPVVSDHIGVIPSDAGHPRYAAMAKACQTIAGYGESLGVRFAIETGPERPEVLRTFLDDLAMPSLGVNFDPANLVMVFGANIVAAVESLGPYIFHTHAKDGLNLRAVDAERLYHAFAVGGIEGFHVGDYLKEVPLGQGGVHFETYLPALRKAGYDGYLTVEREVGERPEQDITQAVEFLNGLLKHQR